MPSRSASCTPSTSASDARGQRPVIRPLSRHVLRLREGRTLALGARTLVMAILNLTPDSFSDGGLRPDTATAVLHAQHLLAAGADVLDVGAESTRPGAPEIAAAEQLRRIVPVVEAIRAHAPEAVVSVDTRSAAVARGAVAAGAEVVNDVSAFAHDPDIAAATADLGVPAVLMHMRGTPADMRSRTEYDDVAEDVIAELSERVAAARAAGVRDVVADPGIGFAKDAEQSTVLLAATDRFAARFAADGVATLVGPSRKSFLAPVTDGRLGPPARTRADATTAAVTVAALLGAHLVRVHDVRAAADAVRLVERLRRNGGTGGEPVVA